MDALEAIQTRRMIPKVSVDKRPSREEIEELLECAVRAPNHFLSEPWRFHVLAGEGLELLAQAIAEEHAEDDEPTAHELADARERERRAPVVIVVTCVPGVAPKALPQEDEASCAMAMENLLLAAHAKGLGCYLRTGPVAYGRGIKRHLGLAPEEKVSGVVYIGYPEADRPLTRRTPAAEKTRWIGWD